MDEFGEERQVYVWPKDHTDGEPYPDDFYKRLDEVLTAGGFEWETV